MLKFSSLFVGATALAASAVPWGDHDPVSSDEAICRPAANAAGRRGLLGPTDIPYASTSEAYAAIRRLDAHPMEAGCGFEVPYNLSQRLLASVPHLPWTLRAPVHRAVARAMRRGHQHLPADRVHMFGQVRLMVGLQEARLRFIPGAWQRRARAWSGGLGPSLAERAEWSGLMRAWLDG